MFPKVRFIAFIALGAFLRVGLAITWAQEPSKKPTAKVINVGTGDQEYVRLLGGPPDNLALRSGAVTLQPGKTVGKHKTKAMKSSSLCSRARAQ